MSAATEWTTAQRTVGPVRRFLTGGSKGRLIVIGLVIAALLVAFPFLLPGWVSFAVVVGIFFLVVLGLDVFLGQAGQVSLGQTLFMALGAYGAALLSIKFAIPTVVSMIIMAIVSGAIALGLGRVLLRLRGYYLALATLGLAVIAQALATGLINVTGGPSGLVGIPNLGIGPLVARSDQANYYVMLVVCAAASWFVVGILRSQTGRVLAAVSYDQHAAMMLGINPAKYKTAAFVVAAVLGSMGGSLYGFYELFLSPDLIAVTVSFNLIVMLALGGSRTIVGPLLGVVLLQLLPQVGQSVAVYEPLAAGIILIIVITYLPLGLWGGIRALVRKAARR
nr:branched-chain amino acid ABC transporter permease [Microbacterium bovistercoris]